jgi:hypothetical protein
LGAKHSDTLNAMGGLASVCTLHSRFDETKDLYPKVIQGMEKARWCWARVDLACHLQSRWLVFRRQGKFDDALDLLQRVKQGRDALGHDDHDTKDTDSWLLALQTRVDEAAAAEFPQ